MTTTDSSKMNTNGVDENDENIHCVYISDDQYADGKAAKIWDLYIGCKQQRTSQYKDWLVKKLTEFNCQTVLDVACGTGVDSIMLLEEGFDVTSTDGSDKMLKYALQERWTRRKETIFDTWNIEEANWLNLKDDVSHLKPEEDGFDALICLGNSFAHLPDDTGNRQNHRIALSNFRSLLKPGGILIIDHRNYDAILDKGRAPAKNIYYNSDHILGIECSNIYVNGKPTTVTLDYEVDASKAFSKQSIVKKPINQLYIDSGTQKFRLSYYPHRLNDFSELLKGVFSASAKHEIYADFKSVQEEPEPAYYIHVLQKPA